ncbi:MAG: D-alanyl-D-alanine carboxypeptidase family protein [Clostridiales bacterium]|nr:D-alanyl-D-alanine carboxypeptidase family protein [Clostridiales bacterium]
MEGEWKMAKKKKDAYRLVGRLLIVSFILVVACAVGYFLVDQSITAQLEENQAKAQDVTDSLVLRYNIEKQEEDARLAAESVVEIPGPTQNEGWEIVDLTGYPLQNAVHVSAERKEMITGGMMLLNHWHSVPYDFPEGELVSMVSVDKGVPVEDGTVKLFPNAAYALSQMIAAAKEAGLENYIVREAYRTNETQQGHYDKEAARYANRFSGDALVNKVRQQVNVPGTSEYQSGLSFRIDRWKSGDAEFNEPKFQTTEHSAWLVDNAWKYGFVFRFPVAGYPNVDNVDKSHKTGESKMLGIYRFVGEGHAAAMHLMNLCMEEYIEYLMAHPHIAIYENGVLRYEITWKGMDQNAASVNVEISSRANDYSISMDNVSGVITCMSY